MRIDKYLEKQNIWTAIVSFLFAGMTLAGFRYNTVGHNPGISSLSAGKIIVILVLLLCAFIGYYLFCFFLFQLIDKAKSKAFISGEERRVFASLKDWGLTTGVLLLFWLPYLAVFFPGTVGGTDYYWQLLQGCGALPLSNHHPVFGSLVFATLYRIGYAVGGAAGGIFFTCLFQILLMAVVAGYILAVLKNLGIPRTVYWVITGLLCICPVFPTHAMWAVKDSIFSSIAMLFFFGLFLYCMGARRSIKNPWIASLPGIVFTGVLFSIYRNGTIAIVIICFAVILYNSCTLKTKRDALKVCAAFIVFIVVTTSWSLFLDHKGVYPTDFRESCGTISRQLLSTYDRHPESFNDKQVDAMQYAYRDKIQFWGSLESLSSSKNYETADGLKPYFFKNRDEVKAYLKVWLQIGIQHPGTYIDEALHGSYVYWWWGVDPTAVVHPTPMGHFHDYFEEYDYENKPIKDFFEPIGKTLENNPSILNKTMPEYLANDKYLRDVIYLENANPAAVDKAEGLINKIRSMPILSVFITPGLYTWIALFCLAYLFSRRLEGRFLWPVIIITAMACLSPVNGYVRYVLPVYLFSLFLIGMCFIPQTKTTMRGKTDEKTRNA